MRCNRFWKSGFPGPKQRENAALIVDPVQVRMRLRGSQGCNLGKVVVTFLLESGLIFFSRLSNNFIRMIG